MKKNLFALCVSLLLGMTVTESTAQSQKRRVTLEEIVDLRSEIITKPIPFSAQWIDDDSYFLPSPSPMRGGAVKVNVKSGKQTPYTSSPNFAGRRKKSRENQSYSPDSSWIAYTKDNNLYGEEIATGRTVKYTNDGSGTILNGVASWVYYEEILGRSQKAYWWSPDGKQICFFRSDESMVPLFPIFNPLEQHGKLTMTRYPKAGDPNPQIRVGIVPTTGGDVVWADFDDKKEQYFGQLWWTADSRNVWVQWMPRRQNELKIYSVSASTGNKTEVYSENSKTWVDWKENVTMLKNQPAYIIQNRTDGWDQIYLYNNDGTLKNKITDGKNFWNTEIVKVDEQKQMIYFTSCGESSIQTDFYSVKFNGSGLRRLTFGEYDNRIALSPSARYFITHYSNITTPRRIALVDVKSGKVIREIADSKSSQFHTLKLAKSEIAWYTTSDGLRIPAIITYPTDMDTTKRYPVYIKTYGGPDAPLVCNRWWGGGSWMAHEGIISVILDHRGSGHCGKKGLDDLYRDLGNHEISDFIDFVKEHLYSKSYVDRSKIGITGHSYGGYLTALALTKGADYFKYGVADAGVMDWTLYDTHYTERYMDTPANNPDGYKNSCVFTYVKNYKEDNHLYIRHGQVDDNVHIQNSLQLIQLLQIADKKFEFMLFPTAAHSYLGPTLNFTGNDAIRFWYRQYLSREAPSVLIR